MRIHTQQGSYLVRGPWTSAELKEQYSAFVKKFRSPMTFDEWLASQGKVYFKFPGKKEK